MLNNKLLIHPFLGETGDTFCLFTKMLDHIFLIKKKSTFPIPYFSTPKSTTKSIICYWFLYRASLVAQMVKTLAAMWETWFNLWVGKIPWRRHGNPLQCSCLENPHGQRSLAGCSPCGLKELDTTEQLSTAQSFFYYWTLCSFQFFTIRSNLQWKTVYFYLILFRFLGFYGRFIKEWADKIKDIDLLFVAICCQIFCEMCVWHSYIVLLTL